MACVAAVCGGSACVGLTEAGVNAATGANRSASPGEATLREKQRMDQDAQKPQEPSAACIDGSVDSTGPLGSPLARVRVEVEGEAVGDGPALQRVTQTDEHGRFHVYVSREVNDVATQVLVSTAYRDRTYRLRIRFARAGYAEKTFERTIGTGSRPERLDVHLERVTSGD